MGYIIHACSREVKWYLTNTVTFLRQLYIFILCFFKKKKNYVWLNIYSAFGTTFVASAAFASPCLILLALEGLLCCQKMNLFITENLKNLHIAAAASWFCRRHIKRKEGIIKSWKELSGKQTLCLNKTELEDMQRSGQIVLSLTITTLRTKFNATGMFLSSTPMLMTAKPSHFKYHILTIYDILSLKFVRYA